MNPIKSIKISICDNKASNSSSNNSINTNDESVKKVNITNIYALNKNQKKNNNFVSDINLE